MTELTQRESFVANSVAAFVERAEFVRKIDKGSVKDSDQGKKTVFIT